MEAPQLRMELPVNVTELIESADSLCLAIKAKPIALHDEYEAASSDRNLVNDLLKELEVRRKELTKPIDDLKKTIMARVGEPSEKLNALKASIEREMMVYKKRLDEERAKQQRELAAKAEAEAKAERERLAALAEKELEKEEPHRAEALLNEAEKVVAAVPILAPVKIPSQEVSTKKNWKFRIVDASKIPPIYCIPNEKLLQAIASDRKEKACVEGVEFYFDESFADRRR